LGYFYTRPQKWRWLAREIGVWVLARRGEMVAAGRDLLKAKSNRPKEMSMFTPTRDPFPVIVGSIVFITLIT
jgi:hypothetical protein